MFLQFFFIFIFLEFCEVLATVIVAPWDEVGACVMASVRPTLTLTLTLLEFGPMDGSWD